MTIVWKGETPIRTPGKKDKPLHHPTFAGRQNEKARSVVALSRVPRLAGFAGSPPAVGLFTAVNRPLVRIPANRHTTTGTCEIGRRDIYALSKIFQQEFSEEPTAALSLFGGAAAGHLEDGVDAGQRGDCATAERLLRPLADQGNDGAESNLGVMYERGRGVARHYAQAVAWYGKASDQGGGPATG